MTQSSSTLNPTILEPLFAPWAEPNAHRVRAEKAGDPAVIVQGRRASPIDLVSNLRSAVRDWREAFYIGASDTTIQLLNYWFGHAHRQTTASGEDYRTRKDHSLKTISDAGYSYPALGKYIACVKVVDTFGCDTSITVEVEV